MQNIDFTQVFVQFAVLILSLSVHEAAHAWSAERLGDTTARMADALGFDPPAGLIEASPREEMLPLDETEEGSRSDS